MAENTKNIYNKKKEGRGSNHKITYNGALIFTIIAIILIMSMITAYTSYPYWLQVVSPMMVFISIYCAGAICISVKKDLQRFNY